MDIGKFVRRFEAIPIFDPFRRAPEPTPRVDVTVRIDASEFVEAVTEARDAVDEIGRRR